MSAATEVSVPDLGDFADVPVIEIHVAPGDVVSDEDPLITLESDKATMDIPSPAAGTVRELRVKVGDLVSRGSPILLLDTGGTDVEPPPLDDQQEPPEAAAVVRCAAVAAAPVRWLRLPRPRQGGPPVTAEAAGPPADFDGVHAGPGVRRLARELGLDLGALSGTGPKGRITKEDVIAAVRGPAPAAPALAAPGGGIPEVPAQDFSKFGPVEIRPLSRIQRLSGPALHRSWLNVPHVTHNDEADITDLDAYRRELDTAAKADGLPGHAAGLPDEGQRLGAAGIPQVQQLADAGEGRADLQGLLPPRRRRGHARGPGGAGDPRRRPQGHPRTQPGTRRGLGQGAGRQARPGRPAGRPASRSPAWAASAGPASRPSSTPPRWRYSAWSGPGPRRSGTGRRSCRG